MDNVISLKDKLEKWQFAYADPANNFAIFASNYGRFKFTFKSKQQTEIYLDFIDSVTFLTDTSKAIEKAMDILYEQS